MDLRRRADRRRGRRLHADGRTDFSALQKALSEGGADRLLRLRPARGRAATTCPLPLIERKQRLQALFADLPSRTAPSTSATTSIGDGAKVLDEDLRRRPRGHRLEEGRPRPIAARAARPGSRSNAAGGRSSSSAAGRRPTSAHGFRSLLLGDLGGRQARLQRPGRHRLRRTRPRRAQRALRKARAQGPRPSRMCRASAPRRKWVEPKLVAEIAFTEFTSDGILRHPSFLGLARGQAGEGGASCEEPEPVERRWPKTTARWSRRGVRITHPGQVLYPEQGITKRDLIDYYEAVGRPDAAASRRPAAQPGALPGGAAANASSRSTTAAAFPKRLHHVDDRRVVGREGGSISTSTTSTGSWPRCRWTCWSSTSGARASTRSRSPTASSSTSIPTSA